MSGITLSASVRQNLLSLQSTTDLLSQTQERLSTGNKVNSALDNPTNYFTASSLNNRASDISNLLDGIGNGVQVLQAANTGITSLQSLISSAQSVANQALQATSGYSTKSQFVSSALTGATASDILGATTTTAAAGGAITAGTFSTVNVSGAGSAATSGSATAGTFASALNVSGAGSAATSGTETAGTFSTVNVGGAGSAATGATAINGSGFAALDVSTTGASFDLNIDGTTTSVSLDSSAVTAYNSANSTSLDDTNLSAADVAKLVNFQVAGNSGDGSTGPASVNAGELKLSSTTTGASSEVAVTNLVAPGSGSLGLTATTNHGTAAVAADSVAFNVSVDGTSHTVTLSAATLATYNTNNSSALITDTASSLSAADVAKIANYQIGSNVASVSGGNLKFTSTTTGTSSTIATSNVVTTGSASNTTGVTTASGTAGAAAVAADSLSFNVAVDGTSHTVTLSAATLATYNTNNSSALITDTASALSAADIAKIANYQIGSNVASVSGGDLKFTSTTTGTSSTVAISNVVTAGSASNTTGLATNAGTAGAAAVPADSLSFGVSLDGTSHTVTISAATLATYNTNNSSALITDTASSLSAADVAKIANYQIGSNVASVSGGGSLVFTGAAGAAHTVAVTAVTATGSATDTTGIAATAATAGTDAVTTGGLSGQTLTIGATAGGTATNITFGTGNGQVSTIDELNTDLASNNLEASIDTSGKITITTVNDDASSTIGTIGGTSVSTSGAAFASSTVAAPVANTDAQNNRASLVAQYNNIIQQIKTTAQDSSFNGVNLLNGDQLKLVFNETGSSTLNIAGVTDDPAGLGLSTLTVGTDFVDNAATNKVLSNLTDASNTLRSQASTLGSNLSIVQIRQDFSKNLINVLQTGASNLTLADTNEEAANSQALSTRQSIAISALALANTSQQGVLQLLR